eukprot:3551815-Prorocentrum_lima.AAC.1
MEDEGDSERATVPPLLASPPPHSHNPVSPPPDKSPCLMLIVTYLGHTALFCRQQETPNVPRYQ